MNMTNNIGANDKLARIGIGLFLLLFPLGFVTPGADWEWLTTWGWLGVVLIGTALWGKCMLYSVLGINTNAKKAE